METPTLKKAASILIAEDEAIVAMDIKTRLQRFGYDVAGVVARGEDAITQAKELKPDVVVMDIMLQGEMDGISAAAWIKDNLAIPIIFLTAYAENLMISRAKKIRPWGYLLKPFDEQQLHVSIEMAVEQHRKDTEHISPNA